MSDTPTVPDNPHGEGGQTPPPLPSPLEAALQRAHAETVRAKDETIATLREHRDRPRQSRQLAAPVTDTAGRQDTQAEAAAAEPQVAERERDELRARLSTFVGPAPTPPAAPGDAVGAQRGRDTPRRPAGLWERLRRALGRP